MTTPPTPANWYPDPEDPNGLRYWDGANWTEHRAPAVTPQPVADSAAESPAAGPPDEQFGGNEQATSIVEVPGTPVPTIDQPTSVITTRSSSDPSSGTDEPKAGAHRAPEEGSASSASASAFAEPGPSDSAPYDPQTYDPSQGQPPWGAPPAAYGSTQAAPSYGVSPTQSYGAPQGYDAPGSSGAPAGGSPYGGPPVGYPPYQPQQGQGGPPQGTPPGANKKVLFGVVGAVVALILVAGLVYFFVTKDDDATATASSSSTSASRSSSSSSSATTTARKPTMTTPTQAPPGPNPTIADYIAQNGIQETPIQPDDPSAPPINIPIPSGWENVAAEDLPDEIYGGAIYTGPELAEDPPQIQALYVRLVGNVDPAQLLALAPGELNNLPGYAPQDPGAEGTLSGFQAYQLAGTYDGASGRRLFAQKTAVIPADDGATYVLQLNVEGPEAANDVMIAATGEIDQGTTIG